MQKPSENPASIALIGYRCCGKTSVGKLIAKNMKRPFIDTDVLIEQQTGKAIEEIVIQQGWEEFRRIEKDVIREVCQRDGLVIATGGGAVLNKENVEVLRKNTWIVWLYAREDIIKKRMDLDQDSGKIRPSLTGVNPTKEIRALVKEREPIYAQTGHFSVDTSDLSIDEIAEIIINRFKTV